MHDVRFTLAHAGSGRGRLRKRTSHTWSGTVPGSGPVELVCPAEEDLTRETLTTWVSGRGIPPMSFTGVGFRGRPRLARMELTADGWAARSRRRHFAVSAGGRALRIEVAGRAYRYRALRGRRHELRRDGAVVTVASAGRVARRYPHTLTGDAQGAHDALDIGLALLLEGVYTRNLTFGGALYSWPGRFLTRVEIPDFF
ncbi:MULTISPECIES: hypothetical protein [Streptomyces]|uniref:hypothetical protein n=1 Tax=Streptomyces TaxID=1883 RepID=UPI00163C0D6C|nr:MULTISPECIES: hypothetical protein [Streptomyces]MBC2874237.1 hypothetical protein [Streptomyces sp. TYQ1024]UBI40275.1 hypothetical protein K7I03_30040 [Streptomyces mobaraensis]UKW32853.1 hypothetical protein MCU78_29965 [Streptomyces sp. TYQ1024]